MGASVIQTAAPISHKLTYCQIITSQVSYMLNAKTKIDGDNK